MSQEVYEAGVNIYRKAIGKGKNNKYKMYKSGSLSAFHLYEGICHKLLYYIYEYNIYIIQNLWKMNCF